MTAGIAVRGRAPGVGVCGPQTLTVMRRKQISARPLPDFVREIIECFAIDSCTRR